MGLVRRLGGGLVVVWLVAASGSAGGGGSGGQMKLTVRGEKETKWGRGSHGKEEERMEREREMCLGLNSVF